MNMWLSNTKLTAGYINNKRKNITINNIIPEQQQQSETWFDVDYDETRLP